jgi:hypothetical protein
MSVGCAGPPSLFDRGLENASIDGVEPDQDGGVAAEVLDVEEAGGRAHHQHLLLLEVGDPDRERWPSVTLGRLRAIRATSSTVTEVTKSSPG